MPIATVNQIVYIDWLGRINLMTKLSVQWIHDKAISLMNHCAQVLDIFKLCHSISGLKRDKFVQTESTVCSASVEKCSKLLLFSSFFSQLKPSSTLFNPILSSSKRIRRTFKWVWNNFLFFYHRYSIIVI